MKQRNVYQEVNSIRKETKPQTLLMKDKEGNTVRKKEEVLQMWFEYYEKHF
jgi:ABC-type phosphate transport system auxiliary subunit